jgi:hypothetical protein
MTVATRNNKKVILEAVKLDGYALRNASAFLRNDRDVVMAAVCNKGLSLLFSSSVLQNDKEVVLAAVNNNYSSFKFASEALRNDLDFIYEAYFLNSKIIKYIDCNLLKQHSDLQELFVDYKLKESNTLQSEKQSGRDILRSIILI